MFLGGTLIKGTVPDNNNHNKQGYFTLAINSNFDKFELG